MKTARHFICSVSVLDTTNFRQPKSFGHQELENWFCVTVIDYLAGFFSLMVRVQYRNGVAGEAAGKSPKLAQISGSKAATAAQRSTNCPGSTEMPWQRRRRRENATLMRGKRIFSRDMDFGPEI